METVPVATVAAELGVDVEDLADRLHEHVSHDYVGLRCIPIDVAKAHIANVHAELNAIRAQRDTRRQRSAAAQKASIEAVRAMARSGGSPRLGDAGGRPGDVRVGMHADRLRRRQDGCPRRT